MPRWMVEVTAAAAARATSGSTERLYSSARTASPVGGGVRRDRGMWVCSGIQNESKPALLGGYCELGDVHRRIRREHGDSEAHRVPPMVGGAPTGSCRAFVPRSDEVSDSRAMGICDGRIVIVTGSGRGLGRAHALEFAAAGRAVVVNDLGVAQDGSGPSDTPAQQVVDEITGPGGGAAVIAARCRRLGCGRRDGAAGDRHLRRTRRRGQQRGHRARPHVRELRAGRVGGGAEGARARPRRPVTTCGYLLAVPRPRPARQVDARIINTSSGAGLMGSIAQAAYSLGQGRHRQPDPGAGCRTRSDRGHGQRSCAGCTYPDDRRGVRRHDGRGRRGRLRRHGSRRTCRRWWCGWHLRSRPT